MIEQVDVIREEIRRKINEELDKLSSVAKLTEIIKEIDEIKNVLDDLKLKQLKLYVQQLEAEEIDDELYEGLDRLSKDALKNPEKCLSADEAIKELYPLEYALPLGSLKTTITFSSQ